MMCRKCMKNGFFKVNAENKREELIGSGVHGAEY